jgi:PAS domain-containing protein
MNPGQAASDEDPRARLVVGDDFRVRSANAAAAEFFHLTLPELVGRPFDGLFVRESRRPILDAFREVRDRPTSGVTVVGAVAEIGASRQVRMFVFPPTSPASREYVIEIERALGSPDRLLGRAELERRLRELV